jgi:hypothetical protein
MTIYLTADQLLLAQIVVAALSTLVLLRGPR